MHRGEDEVQSIDAVLTHPKMSCKHEPDTQHKGASVHNGVNELFGQRSATANRAAVGEEDQEAWQEGRLHRPRRDMKGGNAEGQLGDDLSGDGAPGG